MKSLIVVPLTLFLCAGSAHAYGPRGHHLVGAIADKRLAKDNKPVAHGQTTPGGFDPGTSRNPPGRDQGFRRLRQAAKHDPQWLEVYFRSFTHSFWHPIREPHGYAFTHDSKAPEILAKPPQWIK